MSRIAVPNEIVMVAATIDAAGYAVFLVGGCIRDQLLGRVAKDWDLATSATPDQVAALPPGYPAALEAALRANAAFLAGLEPDARLIVVTDSGHYIQAEQPAVVIEAIRQVVDAVRDPASWATSTAGTPAP